MTLPLTKRSDRRRHTERNQHPGPVRRKTAQHLFQALLGTTIFAATASAQTPGHGAHPTMPDQKLYFQCRVETAGDPIVVEVPLELASPTVAQDMSQHVELPAPRSPLRLARYLPAAILEQNVEADANGKGRPAVEVSVDGAAQSIVRWLIADDPQRNRLISYIATWRYMAVADRRQRDTLFDQFKNELTRAPTLTISKLDGSNPHALQAEPGKRAHFEDLGCKIQIREFFPHFAIDDKTQKPSNLSDKRLNPATLVWIERNGVPNERWVFSKFPDYGAETDAIPFQLRLDCPQAKQSQSPDFMVLTVGATGHEVWTRHQGKVNSKPLSVGDLVAISGANYTFRIKRFVPSSRLVERYRPNETAGGVRALSVETPDPDGGVRTIWLEEGKQGILPTATGSMTMVFGPRRASEPGAPAWSHK